MNSRDYSERLQAAENLFISGNLEGASEKFYELAETPAAPLAYYRLACISNMTGDAATAKGLYYKAFELKPDLCVNILPANHVNYNYVFKGLCDEPPVESCPLCGGAGVPHWCYLLLELGAAYVQKFNPVRVWMYCENCHHIFAENFPDAKTIAEIANEGNGGMTTNTAVFNYYSEILNRLRAFTQGWEILEIGFGGAECALVATELGYDVFGLDISEGNTAQARRYGIDAKMTDFMEFDTDKKWDIIVMGDVIEHISDLLPAMEKVSNLLSDDGVLWLSTPNFESAFSKVAQHNDPMRRVANHKNYFSKHSLFKLLEMYKFSPVDYRVSLHYNGSMEIIAVKGK